VRPSKTVYKSPLNTRDELNDAPTDEKGTNVSHTEPSTDARATYCVRVSLGIVLLGVLLLLLQAMPAFAGQARLFTGSFGGASSTPANPYPLSFPYGVAVDDASHDVYVVDANNQRVEKFGPAGEFILMFGKEVNLTKVLSAAPKAEQNVCTAVSLDTCQAGTSTLSPGGFEEVAYVAVDNSSGESKGDVYIADVNGLVSKFDSSGNLVSSWGDSVPANGQLKGSDIKGAFIKGPFGTPAGVAVDVSGNLWVSDRGVPGQMLEFRQDSSFVTGWESQKLTVSNGIAVDPEDNLYVGVDEIEKFDSAGTDIGSIRPIISPFNGVRGLVVDPVDNELYVDARGKEEMSVIERYDASCRPHRDLLSETRCTPVESFGTTHLHESESLAVDPSMPADKLYAVEGHFASSEVAVFSVETVPDVSTLKATGFTSTSATLNGSVNPSGVELKAGVEGCRFEWGETEAYGHVAPCDQSAAQIGSGSIPVEVSATISGLQQGSIYHFRLVAGNTNDVNSVIEEPSQGTDLAFGPPLIESTSAIGVAASSATVQAQVNPNNVDTRVRVEYGTEAGVYDHNTPEAELGADGASELVPLQLLGLVPHTIYHYRVVAENALGEGADAVLGADNVFATQATTVGSTLPDGRGWELVSPPDKHGARLLPISEFGVVQASVRGDAISYLAFGSTEAEPAGRVVETQILSRRVVGGWDSRDINVSHETAAGVTVGTGEEYRLFSRDLSLGVVQPYGLFDPSLSAEASEQTAFLRTNYPSGEVDSPCLVSCYRPLVTGSPGFENVPPGTIFGCTEGSLCGPVFLGASPDLSHVLLRSSAPLAEGAPEDSLYEWSGGSLALASVLPDDHPATTLGLFPLGEAHVARNAVSLDGSRIIWSDREEHLYVRDSVQEQTVQVGSGPVLFQAASSDGSKIFFTEGNRDEGDSTHGDLRECDIVESKGELRCEITDLTPVDAGENPGVLGVIPGASDDASYVYFVSNAVLENNGVVVPGAQPGGCGSSAIFGITCNLYVRHDGTIKLVAELSGEDNPDWSVLPGLVARVSPNGRWFEFMSDRSLTGYDNRDSLTGMPDEEVYLYDASPNGGEGKVVCASCNPTGARPHGAEYTHLESGHGGLAFGRVGFGTDQGIAANVPGWTAYMGLEALYQSRYLSDSGRLFFNSSDGLVPQDSNGRGDVYEYEPTGVGDCATSSTTFAPVSGGCVGLISSGTSKEESAFLDASENGNDVFFLSYAQLSHRDIDSILDVYDARVGGGFAEAPPPPACEGDACQSPVAAPEDPTPGSLTYSGPGNPKAPSSATVVGKHKAKTLSRAQKLARALSACRRDRSKRARGQCVLRARRRYGQARIGKATTKKGRR
jgi:hypothetical protein